jgi:hypothetical protein
MKKTNYVLATSAVLSLVLAGCASTPKETPSMPPLLMLPAWVANPSIEDGIASAECVPWSGDMSLDRAEAVAKARADLAKQIEIKVKAMDKTYARKVKTTGGISTGGVFETVSKQVTNRNLNASQVNKVDVVQINNTDHLCAMVVFGREASRRLFDDILNNTQVAQQFSPQDEAVLWEEFKAYKAQQELDKETQ